MTCVGIGIWEYQTRQPGFTTTIITAGFVDLGGPTVCTMSIGDPGLDFRQDQFGKRNFLNWFRFVYSG